MLLFVRFRFRSRKGINHTLLFYTRYYSIGRNRSLIFWARFCPSIYLVFWWSAGWTAKTRGEINTAGHRTVVVIASLYCGGAGTVATWTCWVPPSVVIVASYYITCCVVVPRSFARRVEYTAESSSSSVDTADSEKV